MCLHSYLSYPASKSHLFWAVSYCHPRHVWLYHIFPRRLINMIFDIKCLLRFSPIIFLIQRIQTAILQVLTVKYPWFFSYLNQTWTFSADFSKDPRIPKFMKIRPVKAELFHADRHGEIVAVSTFAKAPKTDLTTRTGTVKFCMI